MRCAASAFSAERRKGKKDRAHPTTMEGDIPVLSNEAPRRSAQDPRIAQRQAPQQPRGAQPGAARQNPAQQSQQYPVQRQAPQQARRPEAQRQAPQQPRSAQGGAVRRRTAKRRGTNRPLVFLLLLVCAAGLVFYLVRGGGAPAEAVSHGIEISEIMTSNKGTVPDETGDFPDWIEVHNTTSQTIDIGGFGLSDDVLAAAKWTFPSGTSLGPDDYLVVFCSGEPERGRLHTPFRLSASDVLSLSTESGTVIEQIQLRAVAAGMTLARDASGNFVEMAPSPGQPNTAEGQAAFLATLTATEADGIGVYINEFMASNASTVVGPDGTYCDWIELYNTTNQSIDLSGYGISDSTAQPLKYVLPEGTTIPANGVLLIYCTGRQGTDPQKPEAPFALAAYQEAVVFSSPSGKILDSYEYTRQETDKSMMRSPDGTGAWQQTSQPTPGYPNTASGLEAFTATLTFGTGELMLSEAINANYSTLRQPDLSYPDWIELYNQSGNAINLSGYALSKNAKNPAKWVFPDVTIGPGEYMVVLATGNNVTDTQKKNLETNFGLSGMGDAVFLFAPDGTLLDKLVIGQAHADVSYGRIGTQLLYFSTPTPGAANTGGSPGYAEKPEFSVPGGVYRSAQTVALTVPEGCTVYYTTDCTAPTQASAQYTGPIGVAANTVIRARAFKSGYEPSDVATATYLINTGAQSLESHDTVFSIVSLVTEPDYFYGAENGIYVAGKTYAEKTGTDPASFTIDVSARDTNLWTYANFNAQHISHPDPMGLEWERPVHIELMDTAGALEYSDDAMFRIFGAYSRYEQQKGLALVTRPGYGAVSLDHAFFDNRSDTSYQSLTLRPSAMDWKMSKIRDILIQGLLEEGGSILPTQAYRRTIVYINGKYWGIYNLREKVNKYFLAQRYNIADPETIDILVGNGVTESAQISGTNAYLDYKKLIDWVAANDLSTAENYAYIQTQIDVENFAEYCAMEIFVGNTDTGNIKFWRSAAYDNKWRWIPYDFDWAFNRNDDKSETTTSGYRRNFFEKYFHESGHGVNRGFSTVLSRGLLKNSNFRALFLQKCALMYQEIFTTEKLLARIGALEEEMRQEIAFDTERWSDFSQTNWERSLTNLKDSAQNAPEYFLKYCQSYFSLSDGEMIQLFGKVSDK